MVARSNPIDAHVGARIRLRRTLLGMSQEKLGQALHLTFQQVQKYERGANRIGSGRLYHISQVLDVPVSFFFDGMAQAISGTSPAAYSDSIAAALDAGEADAMARRETLELVRAYYRIPSESVRHRVAQLVQSIAGPIPGAKRRGRPPGSGKKQLTMAEA